MKQFDATLLKSLDEFMESYKMVDVEQIYSNGTEFVPIFRVKQWCEYNNINKLQSNWNSLRELIETDNKRAKGYIERIRTSDLCHGDYPVEYYYAEKRKEITDYYLDKMNELEGKDKDGK